MRKTKFLGGLFLGLLLVVASIAQAAILRVPEDYASIQAAINAAVDGDTVLVNNGTYYENIDFLGKAITVQSVNGASSTTIDGNANGTVVSFVSGETPNSVLDGFTITNGTGWSGGGIYCSSASPTITNCVITGNTAGSGGGGLYLIASNATLTNCVISNNTGGYYGPGGLGCGDGSVVTVTNCVITSNTAGRYGGGIDCGGNGGASSTLYISNSTISNNHAPWTGGGLFLSGGASIYVTNCIINGNSSGMDGGAIKVWYNVNATIVNSTIVDNTAGSYSGGIFIDSGAGTVAVINSILWGNNLSQIYVYSGSAAVEYSDVQGGWPGTGNMDADPLFVGGGDYHLTSGSPCIDTGRGGSDIPGDDIDGDARPQGAGYDIGADEFVPIVEGVEVMQLYTEDNLGNWTGTFAPGADMNFNTMLLIQGDPNQTYDFKIQYFLIDAAGTRRLLLGQIYRNYSPGEHRIAAPVTIPPDVPAGVGIIYNSVILGRNNMLIDRSVLYGRVNIQP